MIEELSAPHELSSSQLRDYATNHSVLKKLMGKEHVVGTEIKDGKVTVTSVLPAKMQVEQSPSEVKEAQERVAAGLAGQVHITTPIARPEMVTPGKVS